MVYGFKHELTLKKNDDNDAIFRANAVDAGKLTLSKISWCMPYVTPADKPKYDLYKIIERKEKLPVGYRMIQCDTAAIPNTTSFSWRPLNHRPKFSRVYGNAAEFRTKFFNMDELVSNPNITPSDYRTLYPLFLFDVSAQSEKLKYSTTDIQIRMHFNANVPLGTQAYAVTISVRLINFQSDGNKMSVLI